MPLGQPDQLCVGPWLCLWKGQEDGLARRKFSGKVHLFTSVSENFPMLLDTMVKLIANMYGSSGLGPAFTELNLSWRDG